MPNDLQLQRMYFSRYIAIVVAPASCCMPPRLQFGVSHRGMAFLGAKSIGSTFDFVQNLTKVSDRCYRTADLWAVRPIAEILLRDIHRCVVADRDFQHRRGCFGQSRKLLCNPLDFGGG